MKIGIFFNPTAGDMKKVEDIGKIIDEKFNDCYIITGFESYGENFIKNKKEVVKADSYKYLEILETIIAYFCDANVDLIVGIGGDGTLNYIACFLIKRNKKIPLMGIAGGTANVGPLLRFNMRKLASFSIKDLKVEKVGGIEVLKDGKTIGYAFIDAVIGKTFLGTLHGKMMTLSAEAFLKEEKKIPTRPLKESIISEAFSLKKNEEEIKIKIKEVSQIVVSPLYKSEFYVGKAITGVLCWAYHISMGGVVSLCDTNVIDIESSLPKDGVSLQHILFSENDSITMENFAFGNYIILDGNPITLADGKFTFKYKPALVDVVIPVDRSILPICIEEEQN